MRYCYGFAANCIQRGPRRHCQTSSLELGQQQRHLPENANRYSCAQSWQRRLSRGVPFGELELEQAISRE